MLHFVVDVHPTEIKVEEDTTGRLEDIKKPLDGF